MDQHQWETQDKIKSKTTQSLQMIDNRSEMCITNMTITKDHALLAIAAHQDRANKEIRQHSQEEQQNTQSKTIDAAVAEAILNITQEAERIKREIQSDKDRYSQSLLNDKSCHIEAIQHKTNEALELIRTATITQRTTVPPDKTHPHSQSPHHSSATYNTQDNPYEEEDSTYNDRKPPARPNKTNFVNLVAQRDEERRQEQHEQDINEHSRRIEDKIHRF
jgi:hypothetical protein